MLSSKGDNERVMPMGLAIDRELAFRSKQMERGRSLQSTTELGFSHRNQSSPDPPAEMVDSLLSERRLSRKRLREATTKLVISQTQGGVVPVEEEMQREVSEEMQREEERVSVESPPQMPPPLQGSGKAGQSQSSASSPKMMFEKIPDGAEDKLLYNQDNHISEGIIHGEELGRFRCIPTNPDKEVWVLTNTQREYVRQAGLHHLAEIDRMVIDHALITGLIERWRPETNSFHFPSGEATITLEDVAYIYGLPIEGPVVVGRTFPNALVQSVCEDLLGITPRPGVDFVGISLKFKWLEDNFKLLEKKKISEDHEIRATRAYLFFLVAGQICTQASGARGPAYLLELFKEFKPYAWAPACLANLYRMLAKATWWNREKKEGEEEGEDKKGQDKRVLRTLTGPLQLLQIWAYSRMSIGRCPPPDDNWRKDIQFPLFKTWSRRLEDHSALTTIKEVRKQLNNMTVDGFNWQPYAGYGKNFLQHVPKVDRDLFSSSTVLIFYWIVERHNTCRVMKQFGLKQVVPPPFNMPFLRHERVERITIDYSKIEDGIEALWQGRRNMVLHGEKCTSSEHLDEYLVWYGFNTISHVGRRDRSETSNTEGSTKRNESFVPKKHVLELFEHIERSCDRADHRKTRIEKLTKSIRRKMKTFKATFGIACENFSMEACSNSQSEHDGEKLGLIIMSDKGKSKETDDIDPAHWSDGMRKCLIDICLEQVRAGGRLGVQFSSKAWQMIIEKFTQRTGHSFNQKQLKNQLEHLKKLYNAWLHLTSQTGIGFNPHTGCVEMAQDRWTEYLKTHRDAKVFKSKPLPFPEETAALFDGTLATGSDKWAPTMDGVPEDIIMDMDSSFFNLNGYDDTPSLDLTNSQSTMQEDSTASDIGPDVMMANIWRKRPRPSKKQSKPSNDAVNESLMELAASVKASNQLIAAPAQSEGPTMEACIDLLQAMTQLPETSPLHLVALRSFMVKEKRIIWTRMKTDEGKIAWLKSLMEIEKGNASGVASDL